MDLSTSDEGPLYKTNRFLSWELFGHLVCRVGVVFIGIRVRVR